MRSKSEVVGTLPSVAQLLESIKNQASAFNLVFDQGTPHTKDDAEPPIATARRSYRDQRIGMQGGNFRYSACERVCAVAPDEPGSFRAYFPVAALNLTTSSAGTRLRSFTSMPRALAHSRTSVVSGPLAGPLRPLRAARRAPAGRRAAFT